MALETRSVFYYGFVIDRESTKISFREGNGPERTAVADVGAYTMREFANRIAAALNAAGNLRYTASIDRVTRKMTISANGTFSLLVTSGLESSSSPFAIMGFASDKINVTSCVGDAAAGAEFRPQFFLQSYVDPAHNARAAYSSVNRSASGVVQVQRFGLESFAEFNIRYITNRWCPPGSPIENNQNAVSEATAFMRAAIDKAPFELMVDRGNRQNYIALILESTEDEQDGTGFALREMYSLGLPGFFETGRLRCRVIEE